MTAYYFVIRSVIAAVICLAAAVFDIKTRKIPNKLTFPAIIVGMFLTLVFRPLSYTIVIVSILGFLFFFGMTDFIGLGDIKLLMAVIAVGGWEMGTWAFLLAILLLFFYACIENPIETYIYIEKMFARLKFKRRAVNKESTRYVFAPFLLLGVTIYIVFIDKEAFIPLNINSFLGVDVS